jgi:hypothetical protein
VWPAWTNQHVTRTKNVSTLSNLATTKTLNHWLIPLVLICALTHILPRSQINRRRLGHKLRHMLGVAWIIAQQRRRTSAIETRLYAWVICGGMDYPCAIYYTTTCRVVSQSMLIAQLTQCGWLLLLTSLCSSWDYRRNFSANIRNTKSVLILSLPFIQFCFPGKTKQN